MYELDGVSGVFDPSSNTICQSSKFVGGGKAPWSFVLRVSHELSVVEHFAGSFVHDCQCSVYVILDPIESSIETPNGRFGD